MRVSWGREVVGKGHKKTLRDIIKKIANLTVWESSLTTSEIRMMLFQKRRRKIAIPAKRPLLAETFCN